MVKKYILTLFIIIGMPYVACAADHTTSTKIIHTPRRGTGKSHRVTAPRDTAKKNSLGTEEIEFETDPENPPVINPSPHVAYDLLDRYPALKEHPEALNLIAQQFNANPVLPAQTVGSNTRRINLLKFSASPAPAAQNRDSDPSTAQGLMNNTGDDGKKVEVQKPQTAGMDVMGNAIIGMLLTNHASSSKSQTRKTYLTAGAGAVATALCGLLVKYLNGQCS